MNISVVLVAALQVASAKEMRPPQVEYGRDGRPSDAIALFDGTNLDRWQCVSGGPATWPIRADGTMRVDKTGNNPDEESKVSIRTKAAFTNFQMHLEFRIPESCKSMKHPQWRGNSGVIVFGCYEIQILGSKGQETYANGLCGSVYGVKAPDVLASRDFGEWESFDIIFHAPVVAKGAQTVPATVTVLQNGVLVQDHASVAPFPDTPENRILTSGRIVLQSHNDDSEPVSFRNIWLRVLP